MLARALALAGALLAGFFVVSAILTRGLGARLDEHRDDAAAA